MLDPNHFSRLLSNPETTVEEDLDKLEQLLEEHPYLQSARALQLKIYKQKNSTLYNDALRKTAAHTTDRDVLFQFITSELFTDKETENKSEDANQLEAEKLEDKQNSDSELETEESNETLEESEDTNSDEQEAETITKALTDTEETEEQDREETEVADSLEIDKPLSFNNRDSYSFSEWMQLTRQEPINREKEEEETPEQEIPKQELKEEEQEDIPPKSTDKVIHLVDAFLKNNPRPKRKSEIYEADESKTSETKSEAPQSLMTETLARVYLQQKNYKKAIQAYKILILKNPEKSGYFADKIRAIEKIINKK